MNLPETIENTFLARFGEEPLLVRSPGRVNIIGEHTDYNLGFVLPAAIEKSMYIALSSRTDTLCKIVAHDLQEEFEFDLSAIGHSEKGWPNYLMGVVDQLTKAGYGVRGFQCVFGGDIPIGAGLSSSAAIEAGLAYGLNMLFDLAIEKKTLVRIAQRAENEFVGVRCGIMDMYVNIFGADRQVLKLDCRSLEHRYYPLDHSLAIVLLDTRVSHSLASTEYNKRRAECMEGVRILQQKHPWVHSLRDVSLGMLSEIQADLPQVVHRRCRYVVQENERVEEACRMLERSDYAKLGELLYASHAGLSQEYEVSCPELDHLVASARNLPEIYGARMMGGGFGGCTLNLVKPEHVDKAASFLKEEYAKQFGREPFVYVTSTGSGTHRIKARSNAAVA